MTQKKENVILLLSLLITTGVIAGGLWWLLGNKKSLNSDNLSKSDRPGIVLTGEVASKPSTGEEILFQRDLNPEKQAAAKAIAAQNYSEAESLLQQSLNKQRNDPEALIYLNNARIGKNKAYSIAVPVPIATEETTAKEILRGVAQAQSEINQQGGITNVARNINNVPLKVVIVNDSNDPQTAKQVAQALVKNKDILGVVGHFSSDVTLAAAPIYEQNKLVAISPSSTAINIANAGNYIFRTVPSDRFTSSALAKYLLDQLQLTQAAIIYNSQSAYSKSLQETFTTDVLSNGGAVAAEVDLSENNFNPAEALKTIQAQGAEALVFLNDSATVDQAYLLMQLNNRQLPQLGGNSLYKPQTLQIAGEKAQGLVLGVPWNALGSPNPEFTAATRRLWGGDVNWRTAMAYDATQVLAAGFAQDPSRSGVQAALSQSNFSVSGASGKIKFLPSGDRNAAVQLVTVQPGDRSSYGYDFVPVK
jgi:branched-chain amino acid transport system substrate-binding protein